MITARKIALGVFLLILSVALFEVSDTPFVARIVAWGLLGIALNPFDNKTW